MRDVTGEQYRPGRQRRSVRLPGVAVPGPPHPRMDHLARPAHPAPGPGGLVPDPPSAAGRGGGPGHPHLGCKTGWPGVVVLASVTAAALVTLRLWRPDWFTRLVTVPVRCRWRWWFYRRRWQAVMTITGLAPLYRGRVMLPVLGQVHGRPVHRPGDGPAGVRAVAEGLRRPGRGPGARVPGAPVPGPHRTARHGRPGTGPPGRARRAVSPRCRSPRRRICGRCRSGGARTASVFTIRLHGTHLLIAGATGAGQGLLPVGPGPGHAARDGRRAGPGPGV